jgi:hypothetical protein
MKALQNQPSFIRTLPSTLEFHQIMTISCLAGYTADRELHPTPKDELILIVIDESVNTAKFSSVDK